MTCLVVLPWPGLFFFYVTVMVYFNKTNNDVKNEDVKLEFAEGKQARYDHSTGVISFDNAEKNTENSNQKSDQRKSEEDDAEFDQLIESLDQAFQKPKQIILYMFQHVVLPEMVFENHPEIIRELSGPPRDWMALSHARSKAVVRCEFSGMLPADYEADEKSEEEISEMFSSIRVQPVKHQGYTIHIVTMPKPEHTCEAYFSAIVFKDDEPRIYGQASASTRYFTLEKASVPNVQIFCEWLRERTHLNFGEGPVPEFQPFVDAVIQKMKFYQSQK